LKHPITLSDDELKAYSNEHIKYEYGMLLWSAGILASLHYYPNDTSIHHVLINDMLTAFTMHTRYLIDFLYSRSENRDMKTDIVIEDFLDESILEKYRPPISALLEEARQKANKQASHLTTERVDFQKRGKAWDFIAIANEIRKVMTVILPHIPDSKFSDELRQSFVQGVCNVPYLNISTITADDGTKIGISVSLVKKN